MGLVCVLAALIRMVDETRTWLTLLESQTTTVEVNGAGSATLWATNALDVRIPGAGSVTYYGSPSITKKITGVGTVISRGNL